MLPDALTQGDLDWVLGPSTRFVNLIEPAPPAFIDHWELGVSQVGVTTDLR